jgi:Rieske Fe-S protein
MTDRRSFLKAATLGAAATGVGIAAPGCSSPAKAPAAPLTIPAASVPVGGGRILEEARFVVTQPEAGVYKAFVKTCTHQGCPVSAIEGPDIVCRCHGARFSLADGSVTNGPAQKGLAEASVTVEGSDLLITP